MLDLKCQINHFAGPIKCMLNFQIKKKYVLFNSRKFLKRIPR